MKVECVGLYDYSDGRVKAAVESIFDDYGGEVHIDVLERDLIKKVGHNPMRLLRVHSIGRASRDSGKLMADSKMGDGYLRLRKAPFDSMEQVSEYLGNRFSAGFYRKSGMMVLQSSSIATKHAGAIG